MQRVTQRVQLELGTLRMRVITLEEELREARAQLEEVTGGGKREGDGAVAADQRRRVNVG
jgi:hypothetical protein